MVESSACFQEFLPSAPKLATSDLIAISGVSIGAGQGGGQGKPQHQMHVGNGSLFCSI